MREPHYYSTATTNTSKIGDGQQSSPPGDYNGEACFSLSYIVRSRRHFDFLAATIGLLLSTIHLGILLYIRVTRRGGSLELLLSQAIISLVTLILLLGGCAIDLCFMGWSPALTWFRAKLWLFLVNSFFASHSFLIIAQCLDRFVALHMPLHYAQVFTKFKVRIALIAISCGLGLIVCARWLLYNQVTSDGEIESVDHHSPVYKIWRIYCYTWQYLLAGCAMIGISTANVVKLRALRSELESRRLRTNDVHRRLWMHNHASIARVCFVLAVAYVVFNWPYCAIDFFYTDERAQEVLYGWLTLVINFMQVVYIQLNLFFFAYCSKVYRQTLVLFVSAPCRLVHGCSTSARRRSAFFLPALQLPHNHISLSRRRLCSLNHSNNSSSSDSSSCQITAITPTDSVPETCSTNLDQVLL